MAKTAFCFTLLLVLCPLFSSVNADFYPEGESFPKVRLIGPGIENDEGLDGPVSFLAGLTDLELAAYRADLAYLFGVEELFQVPISERPPLNPVITEQIQDDGFIIYKLYYESIPGFYVSANLYVPDDPVNFPFPRPTVVVAHGHFWPDGKSGKEAQIPSIGLALRGYVVLAFDGVGSGDRWVTPHKQGHSSCSASQAWIGGPISYGWQSYELSRAIDYLASRTDIADTGHLAVTGASGGAAQTLYLAALSLDDRIDVIVPVCFGSIAYAHVFGCGCETTPYFGSMIGRERFFPLIFPSKTLLLNENEARSLGIVVETYTERGLLDYYSYHEESEESHGYGQPFREWMYAWLSHWLLNNPVGDTLPDPDGVSDDMAIYSREELDVGLPSGGLTFLDVSAQLRQNLPGLTLPQNETEWDQANQDINDAVLALADWPVSTAPVEVISENPTENPEIIRLLPEDLTLEYYFDNVTYYWESWLELELYKPAGNAPWPCVVLNNTSEHLDGSTEYQNLYTPIDDSVTTTALLDAGYAVLKVTQRFHEPPDDFPADYTDFEMETSTARSMNYNGRPLYFRHVYDQQVLISYLQSRADMNADRISLWGMGESATVMVTAGAMDQRACQVVADQSLLSFNVTQSARRPVWTYPPKILLTTDVPHLAGMIAPRNLHVTNARNSARETYSLAETESMLDWTLQAYQATGAANKLEITTGLDAAEMVSLLDPSCAPDEETAISLLSFTAEEDADENVLLSWETQTESDNAGFHLWRAGTSDGDYQRITTALISGEGDEFTGAEYEFIDSEVETGNTYFYQLEDMDIHGVSTFHGPVEVNLAESPEFGCGIAKTKSSYDLSLLIFVLVLTIPWLRKNRKEIR